MHEASLVQSLLKQVGDLARDHRASRVTRVRVRIGELAGVESELFRFAFDALSPQTICDGAGLEILPEPVQWNCEYCGIPIRAGEPLQCRMCGWPARLMQGSDLVLEQVELETV
ncbi:MAG TPA: hydrogenase maturation nickel metallochaperone HypA [Phycisphaerae bacterium]|nr:hydrogenase maturation nickel metallochaperone HypA [Phycisphaerae bacterium]